jgi:Glycosyltransferase family 87
MSSSRQSRLGTELNDGTLGLVGLAILLVGAVVWSANSVNVQRTDFVLSYLGAHMVHAGMGRQLYDLEKQVQLRDSMFRGASPIYFEHPPFEALALAPLASLPFRTAYLIWGLFNVVVVLTVMVWLRQYLPWPSEDLGYVSLWLLFAPIVVAIYQGQSSVSVLGAFAAAFILLKNDNPLAAGAALGIGLLKFQFAVPMAIVFVLRRQWRFVGGFAISAAVLSMLSWIAVGRSGLIEYARLLTRVGSNPHNVSLGSAVDMPTLQGLAYALGGKHLGSAGLSAMVALLSIAVLGWVSLQWQRSRDFDLMFAAAVAASLLSGSHMFTQDFSPLMIGLLAVGAVLGKVGSAARVPLAFTLIVFWTFPLYFLFVKWHCLYLLAIALMAFMWACVRGAQEGTNQSPFVAQTVTAQ